MKGHIRLPSDQSQTKSSRSNSIIKVLQLARFGHDQIKFATNMLYVCSNKILDGDVFASINVLICFVLFLALTGAQEMQIYVCPSGPNLFRAVNLHLYRSESNQRAIREQSEHLNKSHTVGA